MVKEAPGPSRAISPLDHLWDIFLCRVLPDSYVLERGPGYPGYTNMGVSQGVRRPLEEVHNICILNCIQNASGL